jgi:hypothetical protein
MCGLHLNSSNKVDMLSIMDRTELPKAGLFNRLRTTKNYSDCKSQIVRKWGRFLPQRGTDALACVALAVAHSRFATR